MSFYFLDATAFAKLFVREAGTDALIQLMETVEDNRKLISAATPLEIYAAIRRRERAAQVPSEAADGALELLRAESARMVQQPLNPAVLEAARQLLGPHHAALAGSAATGRLLAAREMFRARRSFSFRFGPAAGSGEGEGIRDDRSGEAASARGCAGTGDGAATGNGVDRIPYWAAWLTFTIMKCPVWPAGVSVPPGRRRLEFRRGQVEGMRGGIDTHGSRTIRRLDNLLHCNLPSFSPATINVPSPQLAKAWLPSICGCIDARANGQIGYNFAVFRAHDDELLRIAAADEEQMTFGCRLPCLRDGRRAQQASAQITFLVFRSTTATRSLSSRLM